jgi:RNA polymerase sigma factor (TIGR02999 family)
MNTTPTSEPAAAVEAEVLLPRVYDELRRVAARELARGAVGQTLQATALVHEAWLRLGGNGHQWQNRAHFFGAAAQAMRQILVERARRRAALRHGGGCEHVALTDSRLVAATPDDQILAIHEALDRLAAHDAAKAEVVKLRYFGGLTLEQAAAVLGVSHPTAKRYWAYARAWLFREIRRG